MGIGISNPPPGSSGTSSVTSHGTRKPRSFAINEKDSDYSPVGRGRISSLRPDGHPNHHPDLIIACPGGGYYYLEIEKEGTGLAPWFNYSREWKTELERWLVEW